MAHDGQTRRARQHHADLPTFPRPGAEPGRERLAVPPPELALKHRLRKLRRDRRRRMHRLAKAHRSTRNDHLHRNARLGSRRSAAMTLGIRVGLTLSPRLNEWPLIAHTRRPMSVRFRREADTAGAGLGRLSWAESAPT